MLRAPERLAARWVGIVPHVVDTVLLASALWLAWQLGTQGTRGWLWAKVVALVAYIILGSIALKRGRTRGIRIGAFVAALATFAYIVSVALAKSPLVMGEWGRVMGSGYVIQSQATSAHLIGGCSWIT
jgi:uncharacterized membrane protein SirB2